MMEQELQMIKDRAEKATPGPWIIEESCFGNFNAASENESYDLPACLMNNADAQFVTNAREDIPALIAEVERLQKALKNTDADLYVYKDLYNEMTDKSIELIKFLQTRISKGWGQKAVDVAMMHIQGQEKEIERLREALIDIVSKSSYSSDTTGFYLHCIHEKAHLALAGDSDVI